MIWRTGFTVAIAALLSASAAHAQLLDVRQTVYGMD